MPDQFATHSPKSPGRSYHRRATSDPLAGIDPVLVAARQASALLALSDSVRSRLLGLAPLIARAGMARLSVDPELDYDGQTLRAALVDLRKAWKGLEQAQRRRALRLGAKRVSAHTYRHQNERVRTTERRLFAALAEVGHLLDPDLFGFCQIADALSPTFDRLFGPGPLLPRPTGPWPKAKDIRRSVDQAEAARWAEAALDPAFRAERDEPESDFLTSAEAGFET